MDRNLPVVLIVEDEPLIRMTMHDALSGEGFHVIEGANAGEAIAVLQARLDIVCVVSDVAMPGEMNGFSLAWEMQRRWPSIPVVLSSGHATASAGMVPDGTRFLRKPYPLSDLISAVSYAIDERVCDGLASTAPNVVPFASRDQQAG